MDGRGQQRARALGLWGNRPNADLSAPELYPLQSVQWLGRPSIEQRGHWSLNPYVPADLQYPVFDGVYVGSDYMYYDWSSAEETQAQTRLAIERHVLESIIDSSGGDPATLAPWVPEFGQIICFGLMPCQCHNSPYNRKAPEQRRVLELLRSKAVPEIQFWMDEDCGSNQTVAWLDTRELVENVWATGIWSAQPVIGGTPAPCPVPPGCDPARELAPRLETTLRDSSGDDITIPVTPADESLDVSLEVVVTVPAAYVSGHDFEINLEFFAPVGTTGHVIAYNQQQAAWQDVPTMEGASSYVATLTGDGPTSGDVGGRRTFALINGNEYVRTGSGSGTPAYSIALRFAQQLPEYFQWTHFDLVQVVPVRRGRAESAGAGEGDSMSLAPADVNADGAVDTTDLLIFANGLVNTTPIADINQDQSIDGADVTAFVDSYVSGM